MAVQTVTVDSIRLLKSATSVTVSVDTRRAKTAAQSVTADTKRKLASDLSNIVSLSIGLQNQTLADSYQIDTLLDAPLGKVYAGTLFGWPWECTLQSKQFDPASKRWSMRGDYDVADTLKKYIEFDRSARAASSVLAALAGQLGKTLVNLTDDHGVRRMSEQAAVMQVLSSLYGWTAAAPNIMTNVFLRGDTLYAVQRGKESASYTPVKYNITGVSQQKLDTLMNSGKWSPQIIGDSVGEYTNGTIGFNGCSITYEDGYVTQTIDADGVVTNYGWGSDEPDDPDVQKYLAWKSVSTPTFPAVTEYRYGVWKGEKYLAAEITTIAGKASWTVSGQTTYTPELVFYRKIINHAPIGNGFYSSWGSETNNSWSFSLIGSKPIYILNESVTTELKAQVSEGRPGGAVTPREQSAEDTTPKIDVAHIPFASSHIPVTDETTLTRYYNALAALDGKTEYKMTIDCYDEHIIDYTETIVIDGVTWYLDGNSILLSGDKPYRKQTVQLVRWA